MPWEKNFNTDDVLTSAMNAFWSRGYEATSVSDLTRCMGINRGSLYATFGDKHSLFLQALKKYGVIYLRDWVAALRKAHGPRGAILAAFNSAVTAAIEGEVRVGCFLINTALELSPHDEQVADYVGASLEEMEMFFRSMIEQGQEAGDIPGHVNPVETARTLLGLFVAIRVFARGRPEEPLLRTMASQAEVLLH